MASPKQSEIEAAYDRYDIDSTYDRPRKCPDRYPPDWNYRKGAVLDLYDERCARCNNGIGDTHNASAHLHHVRPLHKQGTHDLSNLVPLCKYCHALLHPDNDQLDADWRRATLFPAQTADTRVAVERLPATPSERLHYDSCTPRVEVDYDSESLWARSSATLPTPPREAKGKTAYDPENVASNTAPETGYIHFCDCCGSFAPNGSACREGCDDSQQSNRVRGLLTDTPVVGRVVKMLR